MLLFYSGWFCEGRRRRLQAALGGIQQRYGSVMEGKASAGKRSPGLSPGRDVDKYFHNHRKKKKKPVDCQAESPDAADNMFELLVVKVSGCSSNVD